MSEKEKAGKKEQLIKQIRLEAKRVRGAKTVVGTLSQVEVLSILKKQQIDPFIAPVNILKIMQAYEPKGNSKYKYVN